MAQQLSKEGEAVLLHVCGKRSRNEVSKRELEIRFVDYVMSCSNLEYLLFCENANHPYFKNFPKERMDFLRAAKMKKADG